jgi:hypothetical protein
MYYRVYLNSRNQVSIVQLQDCGIYCEFDHFYEVNGEKVLFNLYNEAVEYVKKTFKEECINPCILTKNYLFQGMLK